MVGFSSQLCLFTCRVSLMVHPWNDPSSGASASNISAVISTPTWAGAGIFRNSIGFDDTKLGGYKKREKRQINGIVFVGVKIYLVTQIIISQVIWLLF